MVVEETLAGLVSLTMELGLGVTLEADQRVCLFNVCRLRNKNGPVGYNVKVWLKRTEDQYHLNTTGLDLLGYSNINLVYRLGERVDLEQFGDRDKENLKQLLGPLRYEWLGLPSLIRHHEDYQIIFGGELNQQPL